MPAKNAPTRAARMNPHSILGGASDVRLAKQRVRQRGDGRNGVRRTAVSDDVLQIARRLRGDGRTRLSTSPAL
jgi:hypothetical protein